ncbi:MAG TPA: TIGR03790 family protein, partial [Chthonomonadales bacterium]|nr:TIGR03790 family protein [Chthonomonadales bacterium]
DFIVLTKGIPIRIAGAPGRGAEDEPSVDSTLAAMDYDQRKGSVTVSLREGSFHGVAWANRFWNSRQPFTHAKFGGYLVTRLDGYTEADAENLTLSSLDSERAPPSGEILLDTCPSFGYSRTQQPVPLFVPGEKGSHVSTTILRGELAFDTYNTDLRQTAAELRKRGLPAVLADTGQFATGHNLMGYCSWGSNDAHFDAAAYEQLEFAPGGICETAVSTSARTFLPTEGGQSLIADLIARGATGAKGYCNEPLLQAVASPSILFDRYTRGWTLAESYYAASRFVGWEDIVIGDPICRPYAHHVPGSIYSNGLPPELQP